MPEPYDQDKEEGIKPKAKDPSIEDIFNTIISQYLDEGHRFRPWLVQRVEEASVKRKDIEQWEMDYGYMPWYLFESNLGD